MTPTAPSKLPTAPLTALAVLVLACVLAVGALRAGGFSPSQQADAATIASRSLRFDDLANGGIAVRDARSGALLHTVEPGTNGFLRSSVRGLVRERKRQGLGPETPFELLGRRDGRLTLVDPGTGRRIDLESFGPSNAAVFASLLAAPLAPNASNVPNAPEGADHVAQR
jgi:putative photosynthetic complex assembly protein